jgi:dTDP-4-dehydrorhamnose reductase
LNPRTLIIRTSWVYSSFGHNFVKTMLRLGRERASLGVIYDQVGAPTYARDLASAMLHILDLFASGTLPAHRFQGIYHYSNEGVTSWYDFAKAIFECEKIDCEVEAIGTEAYPTPAKRPPFSLLDKTTTKADFGLKIPYWRDSLKRCLNTIREDV